VTNNVYRLTEQTHTPDIAQLGDHIPCSFNRGIKRLCEGGDVGNSLCSTTSLIAQHPYFTVNMAAKTVALAGANGFVGKAFAKEFLNHGIDLRILTRAESVRPAFSYTSAKPEPLL
jgi:hypothetical protein